MKRAWIIIDFRKPLKSGYILAFSQEHKYIVTDTIGCGASCIVYSAVYKDNQQQIHNVRIKEFYPYNLIIERDEIAEEVIKNFVSYIFILQRQ